MMNSDMSVHFTLTILAACVIYMLLTYFCESCSDMLAVIVFGSTDVAFLCDLGCAVQFLMATDQTL